MNALASPGDRAALARLEGVPTRATVAALTFGAILGVPAILMTNAALFFALEMTLAGVFAVVAAALVLVASVVAAWVVIFQAAGRLRRAEHAVFSGDLDTATREARFVIVSVFRADYQLGALFTLALAAERLGAFARAGELFSRSLEMIPAFAAKRPGRRARALIAAHAAIAFAAAGDLPRAQLFLGHCHAALGDTGAPGALEALLDDSHFGAIGVNTILVALENRREPRPVGVLASALVLFRSGRFGEAAQLLDAEQASVVHGLAPNERALAVRLRAESGRLLAGGGGPHRAPAALAEAAAPGPEAWASLVLGPPR